MGFTDNATNEDGYYIYIDNDHEKFCTGVDLTSCEITGLAGDTAYSLTLGAFTNYTVYKVYSTYLTSGVVILPGSTL